MPSSSLPPIDFEEDVKEHEAFEEKKKVEFNRCPHNDLKVIGDELRCMQCNAGWKGRPKELLKLFNMLKCGQDAPKTGRSKKAG